MSIADNRNIRDSGYIAIANERGKRGWPSLLKCLPAVRGGTADDVQTGGE